MRYEIKEEIEFPADISVSVEGRKVQVQKGSVSLEQEIPERDIEIKQNGNKVVLRVAKGNKSQKKILFSHLAHLRNLIRGSSEKFVYKMEIAHVHFPMTVKLDGKKLVINNFLGEKTPRTAKILDGVDVEIKAPHITVTSHDKKKAGQTAANIEKSTRLTKRDRRVFQDGIYITAKPGDEE